MKRFLDLVLSIMAFIILMPLMLIIYILVRVKLGKPAIFKQERPGKDEKIFTLYKFRTMTDEKDENGNVTIYVTRIVSDENGNRFLGVENDDEWNRIKAALRALIKKEY